MWRHLWFSEQIANGIDAAVASGNVFHNAETGLLELKYNAATADGNWIFFGNTVASRDCYLWHDVFFNTFKIVPEFCKLRCYKVVVKFPLVKHLLAFHTFARTIPHLAELISDVHGKCGIDERYYSDTPYDAFFYCDGLEDGLEKYTLIADCINKHFKYAEHCRIILKRSCTEFEREYGPTDGDFWQAVTEAERDIELHINDIFKSYQFRVTQPDWLRNKIIRRWCKFANRHGDKSWVDYFDGNDFLTTDAITYHHLAQPQRKGPKRDAKGRFT